MFANICFFNSHRSCLFVSLFCVFHKKVANFREHNVSVSSASRAQVLPARFSACWGASPIPLRTPPAASGCASETDAYDRGCATTSENTPCEFSSLSRHLRSTSVGAEQAPLALSTAKVLCKHRLWLVARVKSCCPRATA